MISVVIPTYNRGPLIKRAIDSALAQSAPADEIIVVDDGSTDNTQEVCAGFGNRIVYIRQKNAGASVARNTGVHHAGSPWVAFLDSDDYWTPDHLARMEKAIKATNGEAAYYFSDMQMGTGEKARTLWEKVNFKPPQPFYMTDDGANWVFLSQQPTMLQCSTFSKQAWVKSGGLDPRYRLRHDTELYLRMSIGGKVCAVSGVGCVQTDDDVTNVRLTTAVNDKEVAYWKETLLLWEELLERFPNMAVKYRRLARHHLASVHWRLFRLLWSSGRFGDGIRHLPKLTATDPRFALSLIARMRSDAAIPAVVPEYN